ncbi:hypothetical protein EDD85DRAFT_826059 [Armillaria nabsnona]|nr:hypothetical protein EDD85DRAFT_826059 [Armillaria nabsnona]
MSQAALPTCLSILSSPGPQRTLIMGRMLLSLPVSLVHCHRLPSHHLFFLHAFTGPVSATVDASISHSPLAGPRKPIYHTCIRCRPSSA